MLPQTLVCNKLINTDQQTIDWTQAADLVNLNFYTVLQQFNESQHFRDNQYPYKLIAAPSATSVLVLLWKLLGPNIQLHDYFKPRAHHLNYYSTLFNLTFTGDETIVRIENTGATVPISLDNLNQLREDLQHDYMVLTPSVFKYCFSPQGWYKTSRPEVTSTPVRYPLWGLQTTCTINLSQFRLSSNTAYKQCTINPNDYQYSFQYTTSTNTQAEQSVPLALVNEPADSDTYYNPMPELASEYQDRLLGRVIKNDICINVPVTVERVFEPVSGQGTRAVYYIKIPNLKYPDGAQLELY